MRFSLHQIQSQALTAGVVILIATFFSSAMAAPQRPRREEGSTDVGFVTAFAALVQPTSSSIQFKSSAAKEYSSSPSHAAQTFLPSTSAKSSIVKEYSSATSSFDHVGQTASPSSAPGKSPATNEHSSSASHAATAAFPSSSTLPKDQVSTVTPIAVSTE